MTGEDAEEEARNRTAENETRDRTRTYWQSGRSQGRRTFLSTIGIAGVGAAGAYAQRSDTVSESVDDENPTEIDSCVVIDEPGEYELVDDIEPDGDGPCIAIVSDDVVLRGRGHRVGTEERRAGGGIFVSGEGLLEDSGEVDVPDYHQIKSVRIEGVEVSGFQTGIALAYVQGITLSATTVRNNGRGLILVDGAHDVDVTDSCFEENETGTAIFGDPHGYWVPSPVNITFEHNRLSGNNVGVLLESFDTTLRLNRIIDNDIGVRQSGEIFNSTHLIDNAICRNRQYGVQNVATDLREHGGPYVTDVPVVATDTFWGAANGPSSFGKPTEPFTDPETGQPAGGDGDAISQGFDPGVANVRFDPFREETIDEAGPRD